MSDQNMQFPIPNAVLEPYIKAAVSTAIASSLGDGGRLIELAVNQALTQKVNSHGQVSNSSYENTHILAEVVSTKAIHKIAVETIQAMAEGLRPQIKAAVERQLKNKGSALAQSMVEGLIGSLKTSWNIVVKVEPPQKN